MSTTSKISATLTRAVYPLSIFRWRNFALVWSSTTLLGMGSQMEAVVLGWFILDLTGSPFLVGLISAARMGLNFLALFAGAIVDRLPRQRVLAAVEFTMAFLGLLMLILITSGLLEVWHIFAITVSAGMVRIFQMPSAQSLVADTLPQERIGNGAAFTTVGMNLAMIAGPLVGGFLFKGFGPWGAYIVIASLYCLSGMSALPIRAVQRTASAQREPVLRSVLEGLKYVKKEQVLWATLMIAVVINLAGWTVHTSLMPIFARDVLGTDSAGLGLLLFAFGIGAITGSAILTVFRNLRNIGKLLIGAVIMWHVSILVFSTSQSFYLSMSILFAMGIFFSATQVFILTVMKAAPLVADTLPQERIGNGAAFTTVGMNLAMIAGPLVGGFLFKGFGPWGAYIVIASLYCLSGMSALPIRAVQRTASAQREPVLRSVLEGLKYVKKEQVLWATLMIAVVINLAGWTVHTSLMPIFARDVLGTDSAGLGLLLFAFGIGAITGSAILTVFRNLRNIGKLLIGAVIMWHVSILVFSTSQSFYLSMSILFAMGIFFSATQVFILTVILRTTKPEFRGRIIGLRVLAIYAFSFGSVAAGTMAELWGAPWAANIVGLFGIVLVLALVAFTPKLRQA